MLSGVGQTAACQEGPYQGGQSANVPQGPRMPEWQAAKLALRNPELRELLVAAAQAQCRIVLSVDPDIEVYRSFSPMAKITFQRQRNVQRVLDEATQEPLWSITERAREFIRIRKLLGREFRPFHSTRHWLWFPLPIARVVVAWATHLPDDINAANAELHKMRAELNAL